MQASSTPCAIFTVICQGRFFEGHQFYAAMVNLGKIALISVVAVSIAIWMFREKGMTIMRRKSSPETT